jgi:outer membrane scaffolding protein for murein synthesis (MipA/OmpV family)
MQRALLLLLARMARLCAIAALLALCWAGPGAAQTPSPFAYWQNSAGVVMAPLGGPVPDWSVAVGAGAAALPTYEGSKRDQVIPAPVFDIRYSDIAFLSSGDGLGVNILHGTNYRAGIALGYDVGRSQHASHHLNGLGSIGPSVEPRIFFEGYILPFVISANLRHAVGGHRGLIGDVGLYAPVIGNETLVVFVGPGVSVANGGYMQRYFGVDASQAAASAEKLPAFRAKPGLKDVTFGVSAIYHITDRWFVDADLGIERLLGSAGDSPVVQTRNQLAGSVIVGYQF